MNGDKDMNYEKPEANLMGNPLSCVAGGKDKPEVLETVQVYVSTVAAYEADE